jgi:RsiW-degrading membrane proteinase PrsW (M82 family)
MSTVVDSATAVLECIDGKDDFFKIEIENGQRIVLGNNEAHNGKDIKELEDGGCVIVTNNNGSLSIDATNCSIQVKINGQQVTKNSLKATDVLRIGSSIWKMHLPGQQEAVVGGKASSFKQIQEGFTKIIGLEELKDFKLKNIFSQVLKKHSIADMEDQLVTGTMRNTPAITDIETSWAKPWLFARLLAVSILLTGVLIISYQVFDNNSLLIPGLILVGGFAVPISTLVFFLEMNAPRNISIFMTMALVAIGGIGSLVVSLTLFKIFPFMSEWLQASAAGIIEEIGKLSIVILLFGRILRFKWILNGLLLGAAIGTGFAAFESAGYIYARGGGTFEGMNQVMLLRALIAPFMHIIWTANPVAALWLVRGDRKFAFSMLSDLRFVRVMVASMLLHMAWNFSLSTETAAFDWIKMAVLSIVGWAITFRLVQSGLKQLNQARHAEVERLTAS